MPGRTERWGAPCTQPPSLADADLAAVLAAVAAGVVELADVLAKTDECVGPFTPATAAEHRSHVDQRAHDVFTAALASAPVQSIASQEAEDVVFLDRAGTLVVALDPLDGSANVDVNAPLGTIFSVLPAVDLATARPQDAFFVPGTAIVAAGFAVYGPRTILIVATPTAVTASALDPTTRQFRMIDPALEVPVDADEFAINASNYVHWQPAVRRYVDDLFAGSSGPTGRDLNMRWFAALAADAYRILRHGGIFLYPADRRRGYEHGRLRLLYEAHPVGWVIERAGGAATDGRTPILERVVTSLHEHTPLVFGSVAKVEHARDYDLGPYAGPRAPLFAHRGLFRN